MPRPKEAFLGPPQFRGESVWSSWGIRAARIRRAPRQSAAPRVRRPWGIRGKTRRETRIVSVEKTVDKSVEKPVKSP